MATTTANTDLDDALSADSRLVGASVLLLDADVGRALGADVGAALGADVITGVREHETGSIVPAARPFAVMQPFLGPDIFSASNGNWLSIGQASIDISVYKKHTIDAIPESVIVSSLKKQQVSRSKQNC